MTTEPRTTIEPKSSTQSVFIVDDHAIVRLGLRRMLEAEGNVVCCGEAASSAKAFSAILESNPDLAIIDLSLSSGSGLELVKDLRAAAPKIRCLVLSIYNPLIYAPRARDAGAWGYVCKAESSEAVGRAIHAVLRGEKHFPDISANPQGGSYPQPLSATLSLTDRETEVFQLIGEGYDKHDIAANLGLSVKTVETHREGIKRKLGVQTVKGLLRLAVQAANR